MPRISREKALKKIEEYLDKANQMYPRPYQEGRKLREQLNISIRGFLPLAFDDGKEKIKQFDDYVNSYIVGVGDIEIPSEEQKDFQQRVQETLTFLRTWKEELEMIEDYASSNRSQVSLTSKEVFIVHGQDEKAKLELENMLIRLKLEPVILHRRPDMGRTIIEKFETESKGSGYAFVLLTPDDECLPSGIKKGERKKMKRARQNVILELGFFIGRLGRDRVCAIYKSDVDIPTDIAGVLYKKFDESVTEIYEEIRKELATAGYELPSY